MTPRIALATAAAYPDLAADGPLLLDALARHEVAAEPVVWTDPHARWSSYDLVLVRSTWDYFHRRDEFLAWIERVAGVTRLANPPEVLRWNTDKTYLRDLAAAGAPVVPTTWLHPGDTFVAPAGGDYVVKPAVSAGSLDTARYRSGEHDRLADEHVGRLLAAGRTVMVQPYLEAVDTAGETAQLFFAGRFSHAIRKAPMLGTAGGPPGKEYIEARVPSAAERAAAEDVLDRLPCPRASLTYARVDLVPGDDGTPRLMELEVTEPSMFLGHDPGAADRFARAVVATLGQAS
ncbi:MAG TPA: hypothetical protein VLC50_02435 [Actinomycetes bacterium]|nr:hypothetical protein [Actinomycetes bacterium]